LTVTGGGGGGGGSGLGYNLNIRDTSVAVANREIILSRSDALAYWGSREVLSAKLDEVINASIANGWNPAWIVALWAHETGGQNNIGYLACLSHDVMTSLNCFFNDPNYSSMTDLYTFIDWWCGPNLPDICYDPENGAVTPKFITDMREFYNNTVAPEQRVNNFIYRLAFGKRQK